jgi:hypothetical protein
MDPTRRSLIGGLFCAAAAATAIVRISSLMPVKAFEWLPDVPLPILSHTIETTAHTYRVEFRDGRLFIIDGSHAGWALTTPTPS